MKRRIRVFIAFEQALVRCALSALVEERPEFAVVGGTDLTSEIVAGCARTRSDVLLLESLLLQSDARGLLHALRESAARTKVLAVADRPGRRCPILCAVRSIGAAESIGRPCDVGTDCLLLAVAAGATGTLRLGSGPDDLYEALHTVAAGNSWHEPLTAAALVRGGAGRDPAPAAAALSSTDLIVAGFVADGLSNKEIARHLHVGEQTVKKHVGRLLHRLELQDRVQLAVYVVRHPLLLEPAAAE